MVNRRFTVQVSQKNLRFLFQTCIANSKIHIFVPRQMSVQFPSFRKEHGGDEESRTPDPLLARQVLSQLSYTPMWWA